MFTQVTALLLQLGTRRSLDGEGFVASWRRERSYRVGPILASPCPVRTTGSKQKLPTITWHGAFLFYVTSGTRTFLCYKVKMKWCCYRTWTRNLQFPVPQLSGLFCKLTIQLNRVSSPNTTVYQTVAVLAALKQNHPHRVILLRVTELGLEPRWQVS